MRFRILGGVLPRSCWRQCRHPFPLWTSGSPTPTATWSPTRRRIRSSSSIRRCWSSAYTPVEDPAVYAKVWDGFIKHMEKVTGKRVQFFPVQSNAAQLEAMRAGRLHVAGLQHRLQSAGGELRGLRAVRDDGVEGRAVRLRDGDHHLPGSGVDQDRGHQGQEDGLHRRRPRIPGFKAPSALLKQSSSWRPARTYEPVFSGKHDNSVLGVANKDYPAAAIANSK